MKRERIHEEMRKPGEGRRGRRKRGKGRGMCKCVRKREGKRSLDSS